MLNFVKTLSTRIKNGERFIKFLRYGKNDIQESVESSSFGIDSNAPKDLLAIYAPTGEKGKTVVIGFINKKQLADIGETRFFSEKPDGDLSQYIWLKSDETIEIGGNSDFTVRYSELETAFNELRDSFNDLVTKYNTHVHPSPAGGSTGTTPTVGTPSIADISGAKIEEIKTI